MTLGNRTHGYGRDLASPTGLTAGLWGRMKPALSHRCGRLSAWTLSAFLIAAGLHAQEPREIALPSPLFSEGSAWNQTAGAVAVLPQSDQEILVLYRFMRGDTSNLIPAGVPRATWPFPDVTYDEWTIPIFRMGSGQRSVLMCEYDGNPGGNSPKVPIAADGTVSIPPAAGPVRPSAPQGAFSDGHLVLFDPAEGVEYDFWQATTARSGPCESLGGGLIGDAILEAGAIDTFDTGGPGANPDGFSSARAMGTPLLAGLIVPEDIERGAIAHALALAIPGVRNTSPDPSEPASSEYFYPATTTETDYFSTNPNAVVAGQRLRLKPTIVDEVGQPIDEASQLAPITRLFLAAVRDYGAYVVDAAGGFTFYAEDVFTADLKLTQDEVNALIAEPPGTPLPIDRSAWQVVIEALNEDLRSIPVAYGPWVDGQDPATAEMTVANWEVVEPAIRPE